MAEVNPFLVEDTTEKVNPFLVESRPSVVEEDETYVDKIVDVGEGLADIGQGIGAGVVDIVQGITELGAAGSDLVLGTNASKGTTDFFENTKETLGLTPESTAGKVAEGLINYGSVLIPYVGWVGRANTVAKGGKFIPATSKFMKSAEKFGASKAGKVALGNRLKMATTTALGSGVIDAFVSPSTGVTISDSFDALPDFLKTDKDQTLTGREEAFRRLQNKLRFAGEGAALGGAFEVATPVAGAVIRTAAQIPGVSPVARVISKGFDKIGETLADNKLTGTKLKEWLTAAGTTPLPVYEGVLGATSAIEATTKAAGLRFNAFDTATRKVVQKQMGFFGKRKKTKDAMENAYNDLNDFLHGDTKALTKYGDDVVKAGQNMRDQVDGLTDVLMKEVEDSKVLNDIEKTNLLNEFSMNKGNYLRRMYEVHLRPDTFKAPGKGSTLYKEAVDEVENLVKTVEPERFKSFMAMDDGGAKLREFAESIVSRNLGPGMSGLSKEAEKFAKGRAGRSAGRDKNKTGDTSLFNIAEGMFKEKSKYLDGSDKLREAMGEITDPKELYLRTVAAMTETASAGKLYKQLLQDNPAMEFDAALAAIEKNGRPLVINGVKSNGDQLTAAEAKTLTGDAQYVRLTDEALDTYNKQVNDVKFRMADITKRLQDEGVPKLQIPRLVKKEMDTLFKTKALKAPAELTPGEKEFGGKYGKMSGMYVPAEVYKSLTTTLKDQNVMQEALAISLQAKGLSQVAKTVLNPISQLRNFYSGSFMLGANGLFGRGMNAYDSARLTIGKMADMSDPDFAKQFDMLQKAGIIDQNYVVNEYRNLLKEGADLKGANAIRQGSKKLLESRLLPGVNSGYKALQGTYAGVDNFWKTVAYSGEKARYGAAFRKAGLDPDNLSPEIVDELGSIVTRTKEFSGDIDPLDLISTDIVKETMPTYSRVPELVKSIRRIPIVGNFMAFPAEMVRTSSNITNRGLKELSFKASPNLINRIGAANARQLEKQIRAIGAQRLSSFATSAMFTKIGVTKASQALLDFDDEKMAAMNQFSADFHKGKSLVPISYSGVEDGKPEIKYVDLSYMLPYDVLLNPIQAAMQAYSEKGMITDSEATKIGASVQAAVMNFIEPFAGESLVSERVVDLTLRGGRTKKGRDIIIEDDFALDKIKKSINHVLGGFTPGAIEMFYKEKYGDIEKGRLLKAIQGEAGTYGENFGVDEELASILTGFREMEINLAGDFRYSGSEYAGSKKDIGRIWGRNAQRNDVSNEDVLSSYVEANEKMKRAQSQLFVKVKAARTLGLSDANIRRSLTKDAGLTKREVNSIMQGRFMPIRATRNLFKKVREEIRQGQRRTIDSLPMGDLSKIYGALIGQQLGVSEEVEEEVETQEVNPFLIEPQNSGPSVNPFLIDDSSSNLAPPAVTPPPNIQTSQASSVPLSPDLVGFRNMDIANRLGRA